MLTVKEAAQKLGVSETRVRAMASDQTLPAVKTGRQWFVFEWAVDQRLSKPVKAGRPSGRPSSRLSNSLSGCSSGSEPGRANRAQVVEEPMDTDVSLARDLYTQCERVFATATDPDFLFQLPTQEEREFAVHLANFFMERKQRELIEQGVF